MQNENLPLLGICNRCKRAAAGRRLVTAADAADPGKGNLSVFFCHDCIAPRGTPYTTPSGNWTGYFNFTTSNSSGVYDSR